MAIEDTLSVVVACCQVAPRVLDVPYNLAVVEIAVQRAATHGANIVVLPELMQSGYVFRDTAEALSVAESLDGPTIQAWQAMARQHDVILVSGFCEKVSATEVANSAVIIDGTGILLHYQKAHLWDNEKNIFIAGNSLPSVVETRFGRLSTMICYDAEFPEWVRIPALAGADILCAPVNWPSYPHPANQLPGTITRIQAAASTNQMFIAACDRVGIERTVDWEGGSVIVDPDGYLLSSVALQQESLHIARINPTRAREKCISAHNHVLQDRRTDLYEAARNF